jgi:hypothetical protein
MKYMRHMVVMEDRLIRRIKAEVLEEATEERRSKRSHRREVMEEWR